MLQGLAPLQCQVMSTEEYLAEYLKRLVTCLGYQPLNLQEQQNGMQSYH